MSAMKLATIAIMALFASPCCLALSASAFTGQHLAPERASLQAAAPQQQVSMVLGPHTVALGAAAFSAAAMEWDHSSRKRAPSAQELLAAVSPRRLAGLVAKGAQHSAGFSPVLTLLLLMTSWLTPHASCAIAVAWNAGRIGYRLAYRDEPEERRLPVSFAANVLVVAVLGGLSFYNGLKAVALMA